LIRTRPPRRCFVILRSVSTPLRGPSPAFLYPLPRTSYSRDGMKAGGFSLASKPGFQSCSDCIQSRHPRTWKATLLHAPMKDIILARLPFPSLFLLPEYTSSHRQLPAVFSDAIRLHRYPPPLMFLCCITTSQEVSFARCQPFHHPPILLSHASPPLFMRLPGNGPAPRSHHFCG